MRRGHEEETTRITIGIVHGKVSGVLYSDDEPLLALSGTLKNGKLNVVGAYPDTRDEPYLKLVGKVRGKILSGTIVNAGGAPGGTFSIEGWDVDTDAMRQLAGDYEGIVLDGPPFVGKCLIKPNGTFRLHDSTDPDGNAINGQIAGYYVVQKDPPAADLDGLAETGGIIGLLFFICVDGCGDACADPFTATEWRKYASGATTTLTQRRNPAPISIAAGPAG